MKRVVVLLLMAFMPMSVLAQEPAVRVTSPEPASDAGRAETSSAAAQPKPPAPRPPDTLRRRRGSMVGYIDDAVIGPKVRIRFDTGLGNHVPDRAEFFYAKCGCYRQLVGLPPFDPNAPGPGPGIVTDMNFQQLLLQGEYAVTDRFSAFAEMPLRWIQPQAFAPPPPGGSFPSQSGLSDLRGGVKFAVLSESGQTVTVQLKAYLPTGKASNGLGTDHASLEPALLLHQRVSDRLAIESQIGDWHPFGGSKGVPITASDKFAGDVFFYGIGPSYEVYQGTRARVAPVVELVGWHVINGFQTADKADATGTNIVNLKLGARTVWDSRHSFYVGYGHALTNATWYDDIVRFEYRFSF
jgi:hypothetical protein